MVWEELFLLQLQILEGFSQESLPILLRRMRNLILLGIILWAKYHCKKCDSPVSYPLKLNPRYLDVLTRLTWNNNLNVPPFAITLAIASKMFDLMVASSYFEDFLLIL